MCSRSGATVTDQRTFLTGALATGAAALTTGAAGGGLPATLRKHVYDANVQDIDLGGPVVRTWAYGDRLPGKELRVRRGEPVEVRLKNHLPADSSIHWHGLRIVNAMDGVPGVTQEPVRPGEDYRYVFTPPDAGTFWFHSHSHLQTDRGLYGPLIVDDPNEPGDYDAPCLGYLGMHVGDVHAYAHYLINGRVPEAHAHGRLPGAPA